LNDRNRTRQIHVYIYLLSASKLFNLFYLTLKIYRNTTLGKFRNEYYTFKALLPLKHEEKIHVAVALSQNLKNTGKVFC